MVTNLKKGQEADDSKKAYFKKVDRTKVLPQSTSDSENSNLCDDWRA